MSYAEGQATMRESKRVGNFANQDVPTDALPGFFARGVTDVCECVFEKAGPGSFGDVERCC